MCVVYAPGAELSDTVDRPSSSRREQRSTCQGCKGPYFAGRSSGVGWLQLAPAEREHGDREGPHDQDKRSGNRRREPRCVDASGIAERELGAREG
jgi:hypothetical protein